MINFVFESSNFGGNKKTSLEHIGAYLNKGKANIPSQNPKSENKGERSSVSELKERREKILSEERSHMSSAHENALCAPAERESKDSKIKAGEEKMKLNGWATGSILKAEFMKTLPFLFLHKSNNVIEIIGPDIIPSGDQYGSFTNILIHAFNIKAKYKWTLYYDIQCQQQPFQAFALSNPVSLSSLLSFFLL